MSSHRRWLNGQGIKGNATQNTTAHFIFDIMISIIVSCEKKNIFWRYWRCKSFPTPKSSKSMADANVRFKLCPHTFRVTEVVIKTTDFNIIETMQSKSIVLIRDYFKA